ncbi:MAG: CRISPR-associated helicase Cas3' [Deltaproteobacteria bacterium]|nr:CRISPR-associated helicase Cas3' [Deltaproteobacteria bacterium]
MVGRQSKKGVLVADNRKKAFLAAVGVGTLDQALLAVLPSRHQSLRLLGLGRSVLIVDEVHAYDPYMHTLLRNLLQFHAAQGGSAILLSATLPRKTRQELVNSFRQGTGDVSFPLQVNDYPLFTHVNPAGGLEQPISARRGSSRTVRVKIVHESATVETLVKEAAAAGRCACWVRNTVADAVSAYERLSRDLGEDNVMLFHARFALGDRLELERDVLRLFGKDSSHEDRAGKILIATQVVEQSLDLDFDFMVTDLAPIELIIQRAGRLHRHPRGARGLATLCILCPPLNAAPKSTWYSDVFPQASYVYPSHGQLWLAANMLIERGKFIVPDDARCLVETVYGEEEGDVVPQELRKRDLDADGKSRADISLAQLNGLNLDAGYTTTLNQWLEDTVTPTRVGAPTTTVRLARWDGTTLMPWFSTDRFAWDLSQVSVNRARIAEPSHHDKVLEAEVERATESMPGDRG